MEARRALASTLELARRHLGYRLRTGERAAAWIAPRLPAHFESELVPGIRVPLDLRQDAERASWWSGSHYEEPTPTVLRTWLGEAECFFDMGANYGFYSYFALAYSSAEVYAFEPNPDLIGRMEAAKQANQLVRFHPQGVGLGDEEGELDFCLMGAQTSWSTFAPLPDLTPDRLVRAPIVRFDAWRAERGIPLPPRPVWVAKLDVEGFETKALRGMEEALDAHAFRGLVVELNEPLLELCESSVAEVSALLRGHHYHELERSDRRLSMNAFYVPE